MKKIYIIQNEGKFHTIDHYMAPVKALGAEAVQCDLSAPAAQILDADGIVLPGGADIDPLFYHEENEKAIGIDDTLDRFQLAVIDIAVKKKMPVLGICRGLQMLNVYFGGTLIQDLPLRQMHEWDHVTRLDRMHPVTAKEGSFAAQVYGKIRFNVNSAHHQAVDELGDGLEPVMYSDDHIIEGFVHEDLPIIATQWHPERMSLNYRRVDTEDGMPIFRYFLEHL